MKLYHTSNFEIPFPDILHSREHLSYDIIEGGIADDQVFDTLDLYFSGIYTYEQALDQLRFKHPNHQICITNQLLLDKHLHFIESIKL